MVLSTDFAKVFNSVSLSHIENCLQTYGFQQKYVTAVMQMAKGGTVQYEVHGELFNYFEIFKGTGQGDPCSSGSFNLAAAPQNHYLANSPDVPRFSDGYTSTGILSS